MIEIKQLETQMGGKTIHKNLDLTISKNEILGIVGGSGSGKTTLLRAILMLLKPVSGSIKIFDQEVIKCSTATANAIRKRWGVLFQQSALFSSLTLLENVQFPLRTFTTLPAKIQQEIALLKIVMSGLPLDAAAKYPAELSGGMQKRAGLARAIALDPEILFFDEPTAGLDPKSAAELDELVLNLHHSLGLTVVIISHDLDSLARITQRIAFLGEGKVLAASPLSELMQNKNPIIQNYFGAYQRAKEKLLRHKLRSSQ
jgi:phospholipid/cholesterol/gamma-HCH transport system ATP-binding protein